MMAPYAIAHMKIGLKLSETGYKFMSDERVRVYLTNTLEQASDAQSKLVGILPALAHEAEAVNDVKRSVRFTVLVGNPPYSRHSSNPSKSIEGRLNFIGRLIEKYKEGCPELRKPAQAKYLQDDYVKFMRLSEYSIEEVRVGVVGLITNHGFIDNPTFRGMRNHLLGNFNKVRIIDLHGNANKKERAPDGSEDKNVFDIKQGVSVLIGARLRNIPECEVFHGDLWGSREYKYRALSSTKKDLSTTIIFPKQPQFSLRPRDETNENEYLVFPSIAEIFSPNGSPAPGIVTTQDSFAVAFTKKEIIANVERLLLSKNEAEARQHFRFCTQDQWNYSVAKRELSDGIWRKKIIPLHYRPFDTRFTVYDSNIAVHRRERVTKHLISGGNIAMLTSRMTKGETFKHVQVTRLVPEVICMSPMTSNNGFVFPLWLKADVAQTLQINIVGISENGRRLNLGREFLENLSAILCVKHLSVFGIPAGLTPEDIFNYIYAILHSPTYRKRYAEFLKIDFPRVPLTSNVELFRSLATLGGELVALHLLEAPKVNDFITRFTGKGDNSIPKKPTWEENAVWINPTQRFEGVPENVWNFHIGGYQVCEKWLKDRKGRTLSTDDITHYQRIVVALNETIRIMAEIDQVIDEHGGWPIK
jgi:predicted helicase